MALPCLPGPWPCGSASPCSSIVSCKRWRTVEKSTSTYSSAALLVVTLAVFVLSGSHLHDGAESYTSPDALRYHLPMHLLTLALLALFVVVQARSREPFLDFRYFKRKNFSMALFSNTTFHLSMLTVFTLVPILVEDGLGYSPLVVSTVLLCHQSFGLWLPPIAGLIYDRYNPRWLGPASLAMVASGIAAIALFAAHVPIWGLPMLLLPASIGTALFISPYNALVMNTLPENRSFASGMLETTRQMGHTVGTTLGRDGSRNKPAGHRGVDVGGRRAAFLSTGIQSCGHDCGLDSSGGGNRRHVPAGAVGVGPGAARGACPPTQRGRLERSSSSRRIANGGLRLYYPR